MNSLAADLTRFPRSRIAHVPTPIEPMPNLGADIGCALHVKRDDCTGLGLGGNKVRQLEYYMGAAAARSADIVLITGAVQSNFVRTAAAFAARLGMDCHVQLEDRVPGMDALYAENGNVLLDHLFGASLTTYPDGEDEAGADAALRAEADRLRAAGRTPYVIPLGADSPPLGALGYCDAALELATQMGTDGPFDEIVIASGSALTHAGLLFGLRAIGIDVPVLGICVRRDATLQAPRVRQRIADIAALIGTANPVTDADIRVFDGALAPGYGRLGPATRAAIRRTAKHEGLLLDPVYTGKVMAGLIMGAESGDLADKRVLFWHTGGAPAVFAYGGHLLGED